MREFYDTAVGQGGVFPQNFFEETGLETLYAHMNAYEQRRINDRDGLNWLAKFGWLRTHELGKLLWPGNKTCRQQADRLARSWLERKLVLARELPNHTGRALVLATAGVRLLREIGIEAESGKDIGELIDGKWRAPMAWRHDLICAAVLAELYEKGYEILPEAYIRKHAGNIAKIPDGLAVRGQTVLWLEVESARKSGRSMRELANALCLVAASETVKVMGHKPNHALVAFAINAKDENGNAITHRTRVRNAVALEAKKPTQISFAVCERKGYAGIGSIKFETEKIIDSTAAKVRKVLDSVGWNEDSNGCLASNYGQQLCYIGENEFGGWGFVVKGKDPGYADSKEAAKQKCAEVIAESING